MNLSGPDWAAMKVFLLINPDAGGGRGRKAGREAASLLADRGVAVEMEESRSAEDLTRLAAGAPGRGVDRVLVVGGDGTWHFALNGLVHSGLPMALVSCGRGNDFRRNLNLPRDVPSAVDTALNGRVRDLDLIWTGLRHYIGVGGVGFDSEVTECANTQVPLFTGTLAYTVAVFYKLLSFKPKRLTIRHDGGVFENEVMFAVFGNSKSYGGGMKITPEAEMDDGLIDVVVVERGGHWHVAGHPAQGFFRQPPAASVHQDLPDQTGGTYVAGQDGPVRRRGIHPAHAPDPGNPAGRAESGDAGITPPHAKFRGVR